MNIVVFIGLIDRSHLVDIFRHKKNGKIFIIDGEINYWNLTRATMVDFHCAPHEYIQENDYFQVTSRYRNNEKKILSKQD